MGTKTRDLSKLGAGFVVDGTKSRIDSDNTIETFTTLSVKRDNATYNSGKDSDIFVVNPDQANPTIETRHSTQIKDKLVFTKVQADDNRKVAKDVSGTVNIRAGQHFDSDIMDAIVDAVIAKSRNDLSATNTNYNPKLRELQAEMATRLMSDMNADKGPTVGQYLRWTGNKYEPQDPDATGNFTIDFQSAAVSPQAITDSDTKIGFSKVISNANALVFVNGHLQPVDSDAFGDGQSPTGAGTTTRDSDSDKYAIIDYKILANVTTKDVDQVVSGPSDAIKFYGSLKANDEVSVISPIDETVAHFYKNFRFADSDFVVMRKSRRADLSPNGTHQTFRMIDSDIYNDSDLIVARVGGNPLIFLNGINLSQAQGDFYFWDSDSDQVNTYKTSRIIAFDSDQFLKDSDELSAVWIRNVSNQLGVNRLPSEAFQTLEHTFTVNDSDHPGFTTGLVDCSPVLQTSNDPFNVLVFLNGVLLSQSPVLEYQVNGNDILFPSKLNVNDFVAIYSFSGPTAGVSTLGQLSNVDEAVDGQQPSIGEALVYSGGQWTHQFSDQIKETPLTSAWMRVSFDSDNGPNPNKIIDRATYGFDSDQLKYSRHAEGVYYFLLDSEVVPVNDTNGFYMSMAVSSCAPQGQPIFQSIDAQGADAVAPGPGADSETGRTIDVFGGKPLIANPNNRAIRVRTWDASSNPIDPIQINVQVWFKRQSG